jgi:hypothetical protein
MSKWLNWKPRDKDKTLCCPLCGSDNIVFASFVDEHYNYINCGGGGAVYCNCISGISGNDEIEPILKSEYKKEEV